MSKEKIKLICRRPGMRRCNQVHGAEKVYAADHWTQEQLAIFEADPDFALVAVDGSEDDTSSSGEPDPIAPEGDELIDAIVAEIRKLDPGVKPTVAAMKKALGYDIKGRDLGAAIKKSKE